MSAVGVFFCAVAAITVLFCAAVAYFYRMAFSRGFRFPYREKNDEASRRAYAAREKMVAELNALPSERLEIVSGDGKRLVASFYPNGESKKALIAIHGWRSSRGELAGQVLLLRQLGYAALTPDLKAHGESEGKTIGFGWEDRLDILRWIDALRGRGYERIGLIGVSMGAATVMMTCGEALPPEVSWAVEDCGYSGVKEQLLDTAGVFLKKAPWLALPIVDAASVWCRLSRGFFLKRASCTEQLKKCAVPMLLIHGTADDFVPYRMLDINERALSAPHRVLRVEGARHARSMYTDPALYRDTVAKFVNDVENREEI